jgi:hypothetical protein
LSLNPIKPVPFLGHHLLDSIGFIDLSRLCNQLLPFDNLASQLGSRWKFARIWRHRLVWVEWLVCGHRETLWVQVWSKRALFLVFEMHLPLFEGWYLNKTVLELKESVGDGWKLCRYLAKELIDSIGEVLSVDLVKLLLINCFLAGLNPYHFCN